jgi:hypothetical protein
LGTDRRLAAGAGRRRGGFRDTLIFRVILAREHGEGLGRVQPQILGITSEEAAGIDRRRYDLKLLRLERLEVPAGNACVAFSVFERQAAGFSRTRQEAPQFTHASVLKGTLERNRTGN